MDIHAKTRRREDLDYGHTIITNYDTDHTLLISYRLDLDPKKQKKNKMMNGGSVFSLLTEQKTKKNNHPYLLN